MLKSQTFIEDEIDRTNALIRDIGFMGDIRFRPPYCKKLLRLPLALAQRDMVSITWDVEPESYGDIASSPERIADYVVDNIRSGSIVLLHPMYDSGENARNAIPMIVRRLRAQGYEFLTVNEMLAL